ncbi:MAG TPA: DNA repair protein RecN [Vicinamibacterales bacterium]|nr:DNA repair protein RecN [Vicinamibacterales bacterium]
MLRFLAVRHLAVIDQLEVEFEPGLNLLTGETGAGKSVLVEAVDLLTGARASADLVRTGEELATIQAIFERPDGRETIVRREISASGRSRAFIDDALATTAALKELGTTLVDLHGQHEHQTLLDEASHLELLDTFGRLADVRQTVATVFERWRAAAGALDRVRLDDREKRARIEIASFQLQEIDKVAPAADEDATLADERAVLANADRLSRLSTEAYAALYDGEAAALSTLATVWRRIGDLAAIDPRFRPYLEQRDTVQPALDDLAFFLRGYAAGLDASPDRLQAVEDRLAALERLKKKHGPTLADVMQRRADLQQELAALGASEEDQARLERAEQDARAAFLDAGRALSADRQRVASEFSRALEKALAELAMAQSRVAIRVAPNEAPETWTSRGLDAVEFLLSPNPGEEPRALSRIASGGELSRIMLAMRTLASPDAPGRTLVFDEVDAGIGGAAADAVGARLQALAARDQVVCITHLPQIAARAGTHFQIAKHVRAGRTLTTLVRLDRAGREAEIARMIAGAEITDRVLASARDLLQRRGETKTKEQKPAQTMKSKGARRGT